jgi:tetratricopeptide (TPR) repeat protein
MAKPMLVTLPFVLMLLDYWPLNRFLNSKFSILNSIIEKIPLFALSAVSSVIVFITQRAGEALTSAVAVPLKHRIINALISYVTYIEKMFWPSRLAVFYPYFPSKLTIWSGVAPLLLLVAMSGLVLWLAKRHRYMVTGWFWYLGTLVPVIGLVQVGSYARADRFTYITLTGLFIIVAWGVGELSAKWPHRKIILWPASMIVLSVLAICAYLQTGYWKDDITLYQHAIEVTENNSLAHINIALPLFEQGRVDEAVRHITEAVRIAPKSRQALNAAGFYLYIAGRIDEAAVYYERILEIDPTDPDAHANLGYTLKLQGDLNGALTHLTEAVRLDPKLVTAHFHLGNVLAAMGRTREAVTQLEEALRLKPDSAQCMNSLAWFLATADSADIRDPDRAIELAERACELTGYNEPAVLDTLAAAYAAAGNFTKAVDTARKALELCQSSQQDTLKHEIEKRLALYEAGKPYVEGK